MNPQLEKFSTEQLKAMAYDELARLEVAQNNLKILNQEIAERQKPKPEPQPQVVEAE